MQERRSDQNTIYAARCVADYAVREQVLTSSVAYRPVYHHLGAVLADSILQAGLNYSHVVRPRIQLILETFPDASTLSVLSSVLEKEGSERFLSWEHSEKIYRFESLVEFLVASEIEDTYDLRNALQNEAFRERIREVHGVGPKTVDYMACLVGVDCIAVDRHIVSFAKSVGLVSQDYDYLKKTFSFAADLLAVSRRQFDGSIWSFQALKAARQRELF